MKDYTNREFRNRLLRHINNILNREGVYRQQLILEVLSDEFFIGTDALVKKILTHDDDTSIYVDNTKFTRELPIRLAKIRSELKYRSEKKIKINHPSLFQ